jgi:DMSO/TMAO reductase YedYZ molybdopterin-dependent catalytic subunit
MKSRTIWLRWLQAVWITALITLTLAACGSGAPNVDWTLTITGDAADTTEFSYKALTQMEQVELNDLLMEKSTGEDEVHSWSGVPADTLLAEAGVSDYSTITAVAGDGYAIEISKDEMQGAIVALKKNGEWIPSAEPDKGPIRLVCPETPANRWVFQLQELQVNP